MARRETESRSTQHPIDDLHRILKHLTKKIIDKKKCFDKSSNSSFARATTMSLTQFILNEYFLSAFSLLFGFTFITHFIVTTFIR